MRECNVNKASGMAKPFHAVSNCRAIRGQYNSWEFHAVLKKQRFFSFNHLF